MWHCSKCGEDGDDALDVCWNCGTSKSGDEDPNFRKADDPSYYQCLRCGKQGSWPVADGLSTCPSCQSLLKLERDEPRHCPVDGVELTKMVVQNVVVDTCPSCHGVWLDGGELELIKQALKSKGHRNSTFVHFFPLGIAGLE